MIIKGSGEIRMNNIINQKTSTEVNWTEVIWDLLERWKAVLITALAVVVLLAGAKYAKDVKEYRSVQKEKAAMEAASEEEQIKMILGKIPEKERAAVLATVNQKEMLETERAYLGDSILMNTDPTNQRMLVADYHISTDGQPESAVASLLYSYKTYLNSDDSVEKLREAIDSDAESNYIAELISTDDSDPAEEAAPYDVVLKVQIVLPAHADCEKVAEVLAGIISECSAELSGRICPHSVSPVSAEEQHRYNADAVKKRNDTLENISTLQDNIGKIRLSEGQEAAVEAIRTIRSASAISESKDDAGTGAMEKPGIDGKYMFLGFILGILMYSVIYLLIHTNKGSICSAADTECCTRSRLLGEVYHAIDHKGLDALLHSRLVDKYRYKGKLDESEQIRKAASKTAAVCGRISADEVTVLCMPELTDAQKKVVDAIKSKCPVTDVKEIPKQADDEYLLSVRNTVLLVDDSIKAGDVITMTAQLADCSANLLGSIFYRCI